MEVALTYVYGIGLPTSQKILAQTNVNPDTRVRDLTEEQVNRLRELIDRRYKVEGDLRREVALNIKRLIEIGSYRGLRHRRNLPVRGQRTRRMRASDAVRRTVGVRREVEADGEAWRNARRRQSSVVARRRTSPGTRPHPGDVQQHAHHDHRPERRGHQLGFGRHGRLQGLAQEHAVCRCAVR